MASRFDSLGFPKSSQRLLGASGVSDTLVGAKRTLEICAYALEEAQCIWPDTIAPWQTVVDDATRAVLATAAVDTSNAAAVHAPLSTSASDVASFETPMVRLSSHRVLAALLGRGICVAASQGVQLSRSFQAGLRALQLARNGRGRNSEQWLAVLSPTLLKSDEVLALCKENRPVGVVADFLRAALQILEGEISDPAAFDQPRSSIAKRPEFTNGETLTRTSGSANGPAAINKRGPMKFEPSISDHLAAAEVANVGEKLGYCTHNQLFPADLRQTTRNLRGHAKGKERIKRGLARYALASLFTGCSEDASSKLGFSPGRYSIWLDPEKGGWCWNFAVYRDCARRVAAHAGNVEPIFIPFPSEDAEFWRGLRRKFPTAASARELIEKYIGRTFSQKEFRKFLRKCGCSAHPAYRGRFARSLWCVYLQETGSDMAAAFQTGHFCVCAPSSLFYFDPTPETTWARANKVYQFLELGNAEPLAESSARTVCRYTAARAALLSGWPQLVEDINAGLAALRSAERDDKHEIAAALMEALCTAFIVATAGRGTRLDLLTFGALVVHPRAMTILDKDEGGGHSTRLLPKTNVVLQIIAAALECHRLWRGSDEHDSNDPLFISWSNPESGDVCMQPERVRAAIRNYFGDERELNFGRSLWVTHLDEKGCDRWLIRVLTGHARDVTRTHGAYMDIPPLRAAERLEEAMNEAWSELAGTARIEANEVTPKVVSSPNCKASDDCTPTGKVPDPRGLLPPLSPETLAGWLVVEQLRRSLVRGLGTESANSLAALWLTVIDLIPDASLCLQASVTRTPAGRHRGVKYGLDWDRPHFTHLAWLPIQNVTLRLLFAARTASSTEDQVKKEVRDALLALHPGYWPTDPAECWTALAHATAHYRRLEFPPSLVAVSLPRTPAPCLSALSLLRLANDPVTTKVTPEPPIERGLWRSALPQDDELDPLRTIVGRYKTSIEKIGELEQRARDCLAKIEEHGRPSGLFAMFIFDWLIDELNKSIEGKVGRLDISSIYTYLGVLIRRSEEFANLDPGEWTEDEWLAWLRFLQREISTSSDGDVEQADKLPKLEKAVRVPVLRLVQNVVARDFFVPATVRAIVAEAGELERSGSASATLILDADIAEAMRICRAWTAEDPLDQLLLLTRAEIQDGCPTRTNEISSLGRDCLTPGGAMLIERYGYKVHKTDNAIRCISVNPELAKFIEEARAQINAYRGAELLLLLRGSGQREDGLRDGRLIYFWSSALKLATGDQQARPRCVRAKALQDIAWPGWSEIAGRLLRGNAGWSDCSSWINAQFQEWTRMSFAAVQAGHGDLRSALGNYLAGWPFVFHMFAASLLERTDFAPELLDRLSVKRNSLFAARKRGGSNFVAWDWLEHHIQRLSPRAHARVTPAAQVCNGVQSEIPTSDDPPNDGAGKSRVAAASPTSSLSQVRAAPQPDSVYGVALNAQTLRYLAARVLDMSQPEAIEATHTPLTLATLVERVEVPVELRAAAVRRARAAPDDTARKSNQKVLLDSARNGNDLGQQIIDWLMRLDGSTRLRLFRTAFKLTRRASRRNQYAELWEKLSATLPPALRLRVHRSPLHLTSEEDEAVRDLPNYSVEIKKDSDVGADPVIKVLSRGDPDNRVLSSRLTSVFRASLLSAVAIQFGKGAWND